jgi:hypothetical protein
LPRLKSLFFRQTQQRHPYYHAKGQLVRGTLLMEEDEVDLTNEQPDAACESKHGRWLKPRPQADSFLGNLRQNKRTRRRRRIVLASFTAQRRITFQELLRLDDEDDEDDDGDDDSLFLDGK